MNKPKRKRVVILGGGFAGFYAALQLDRTIARDPNVEVLLVDRQNFLVFTPMLHEVASGSLDPSSIVVPFRQALRHVRFLQADITAIDLDLRTVSTVYGIERHTQLILFDQLLMAAGSQTRFPAGLRQHAHGMKTIQDALILRNWLIALLERAEVEEDPQRRRALLTVVVAGGGFSGVEAVGAINDFIRDISSHYPRASAALPSPVLVESHGRLLPDFDSVLGQYAEAKLRAAGIDVRLATKVAGYDGRSLLLDAPEDVASCPVVETRTLIWTAGVGSSPLIDSLPLTKEKGRIIVDENLAVPGIEGLWACGDCAAIRDPTGRLYPTTAQHAANQGRRVGRNIVAVVRGRPHQRRPFRYKMRGQFAAIGRQSGVAALFGLRFSGFAAWLLWRGVYLLLLPRIDRKIRVLLQWLLDIGFPRDTVQLLNVEDVRSGRLQQLLASAGAAEAE